MFSYSCSTSTDPAGERLSHSFPNQREAQAHGPGHPHLEAHDSLNAPTDGHTSSHGRLGDRRTGLEGGRRRGERRTDSLAHTRQHMPARAVCFMGYSALLIMGGRAEHRNHVSSPPPGAPNDSITDKLLMTAIWSLLPCCQTMIPCMQRQRWSGDPHKPDHHLRDSYWTRVARWTSTSPLLPRIASSEPQARATRPARTFAFDLSGRIRT